MLLITKVEVAKIDGPIARINHYPEESPLRLVGPESAFLQATPPECTQETIIGETYQVGPNPQNRVVLGMTKEVKQTLGIPLESMDTLYEEFSKVLVERNKARQAINTASFGARLRYLFNPKKGLHNDKVTKESPQR